MEVKNPLVFLNKKNSSITKTFITNLFIGLIAFAVFSGVTAIASAQEETSESVDPKITDKLHEVRQTEIKEKIEEQKTILDARREAIREQAAERNENIASRTEEVREQIHERKTIISERIKNRILALAENITRKMKAAVGRLTQIIARFETRIDTLETRGVDGGPTQTKLNEATDHLARATSILENEVNDQVDATVGSDNPREAWINGKAKYQEAREAIRSAHQAIREALALLKQAVADAELEEGISNAVQQNNSDSTETESENTGGNEESNQ